MPVNNRNPITYSILGLTFIVIGVSVFAIRLTHPGPYAMPQGAGSIGAVIAVLIGGYLMWPGKPKFTGIIAAVIALVASLPAIYSIAGESQEVISLYAKDADNQNVDLRLWIVDRPDGAWVGMGKSKAINHQLDGATLEMLRGGKIQCVVPSLFDDQITAQAIHAMKIEKYTTAQIASSIGLYPSKAGPSTVALRLDAC